MFIWAHSSEHASGGILQIIMKETESSEKDTATINYVNYGFFNI